MSDLSDCNVNKATTTENDFKDAEIIICDSPPANNSISTSTAIITPLKTNSKSIAVTESKIKKNTVTPLIRRSNTPTTSIKPLILPAPVSECMYNTKLCPQTITPSSIVHNSIAPATSSQTNYQPPMAMGIATIQPQQFSYSGLPNNRYSMMPMSIANNYSSQSITLSSSGLGTAVQLMPVLNQNNNQISTPRMQSVPFFMTPIIAPATGNMIFSQNMTIMPPHSSNSVMTSTIVTSNPNTSSLYSIHSEPTATLVSSNISTSTSTVSSINNVSLSNPLTVSQCEKQQSDDKITSSGLSMSNDSDTLVSVSNLKIQNNTALEIDKSKLLKESSDSIIRAANFKKRELIRTKIYRMKPTEELTDKEDDGKFVKLENKEGSEKFTSKTSDCLVGSAAAEVKSNVLLLEGGSSLEESYSDKKVTVTTSLSISISTTTTTRSTEESTGDFQIQQETTTSTISSPSESTLKLTAPLAIPPTKRPRLPSPEILNEPTISSIKPYLSTTSTSEQSSPITTLTPKHCKINHNRHKLVTTAAEAASVTTTTITTAASPNATAITISTTPVTSANINSESLFDKMRSSTLSNTNISGDKTNLNGNSLLGVVSPTISNKLTQRQKSNLDKKPSFHQEDEQPKRKTAVVRPEQRKILVHYLDDLIIFESDEPFPSTNKLQVVKSAFKAGRIKFDQNRNQKQSVILPDQILYTDEDKVGPTDSSPTSITSNRNSHSNLSYQYRQNTRARLSSSSRSNSTLSPSLSAYSGKTAALASTRINSADNNITPLTVDIPNSQLTSQVPPMTTSESESVDSSQFRPLSTCSQPSPVANYSVTPKLESPRRKERISPNFDQSRLQNESNPVYSSSRTSTGGGGSAITFVNPLNVQGENGNDQRQQLQSQQTSMAVSKQQPQQLSLQQKLPHMVVGTNNIFSSTNAATTTNTGTTTIISTTPTIVNNKPIVTWTVTEVADFVRQTPGCENYASMFMNHEIDGEALLLLSKDNLIQGALNMKIGPALKLCARIDKRRLMDNQMDQL